MSQSKQQGITNEQGIQLTPFTRNTELYALPRYSIWRQGLAPGARTERTTGSRTTKQRCDTPALKES